ncbi:hypothetical protein [Planktotalea sp.]|uniref:hypothetical protein n=1 Tax=Planktotalea sp. TaxID=2029877 RepID=UPI0025D1F511|nr:hypothetical protein [Planktotalea sp.]
MACHPVTRMADPERAASISATAQGEVTIDQMSRRQVRFCGTRDIDLWSARKGSPMHWSRIFKKRVRLLDHRLPKALDWPGGWPWYQVRFRQ